MAQPLIAITQLLAESQYGMFKWIYVVVAAIAEVLRKKMEKCKKQDS